MDTREHIGNFPFTVEARVAIQLGRESISSSLVAIGELIKNAYDADAEEVILKFEDLDGTNPTLTITDDGDGMSEETLISKWMRIGTTHKSEVGVSKKSRVYTGAKGLGRLGIDRLCSKIELFTKTEKESTITEVVINWGKYSTEKSAELESIKHSIYKINSLRLEDQNFPLPNKNKGSQYRLTGLKDEWDYEFLDDLRRELALLVSPFSKELDFRIKFDTSERHPELDGYISSEHFLEAAEWQLHADITDEHHVKIKIYDETGKVSFSSEPSNWKDWMSGRGEIPLCGPLSFKLYFMRNISSKRIDTNKFKAKDVRSFLKNNQGVRIYRDHFRVKPYGEPSGEGDWLGLAMRRVKNPESITMENWKIGYNQTVGAIFIGRDKNRNLIDQTNREGLTETPAYWDLRSFALKSIELFEKHVQQISLEQKNKLEENRISTSKVEENVSAYKQMLNSISQIKNQSNDESTKKQLSILEKKLSKETEITASFKERIDRLEAEKDTLANLASLGILSVSFGHETLAAIATAVTNSDLLKERVNQGFFMLPQDIVDFANKRFEQIDRSLNYIKIFGNFSLGNVRRDKRNKKSINLQTVIQNVLSSFDEMLSKKKIRYTLTNESGEALFIRAYEIDWESIFANLITNSCWALADTAAENRQISITLKNANGIGIIEFEDSGCGIEAGVENHIFKATFTTKRNKKGDATGTGMGLSIVKTFIEDHSGGNISLAPKGALGGAKFTIKVPTLMELKI